MDDPTLLDDSADEPSMGSLSVPVKEADARTAVWLGHKLTRRLAGAGIALIIALAGLWGNAQLDATQGLRTDVARYADKIERRMETTEGRLSVVESRLAVAEASPQAAALDARIKTLELWMWSLDKREEHVRKKAYDDRQKAPKVTTTPEVP